AHIRPRQAMLHPRQSARWSRGGQLRSLPAADQDSPQGPEGRLAPLRTELLPALSPGGATCAAGRHIHLPHRFPLRHPRSDPTMTPGLGACKPRLSPTLFIATMGAAPAVDAL